MAAPQLPQFNAQELLDQILNAGKKLAKDGQAQSKDLTGKAKNIALKGEDALIDKLGIEDSAASRDALRKGAGAAGALALLLSSRSARKMATVGGLAGLGVLKRLTASKPPWPKAPIQNRLRRLPKMIRRRPRFTPCPAALLMA